MYKRQSDDSGDLLEQVKVENRERYDYKKFLRKFAVLKEEMQVDADSFDYVFYTYGLELYGNMPLIEPQETKEMYRVEDFVIVIDTSMSCSGELVKRFLEETYAVLCESESYFRKINIHIIPVSYTHLDVYKRQMLRLERILLFPALPQQKTILMENWQAETTL